MTKANIEDLIAATSVNFEINVVEPGKNTKNDTNLTNIYVNLYFSFELVKTMLETSTIKIMKNIFVSN